MKAEDLLNDVVHVMADVLVHQRARWGALLGHQRQYEGWWKAEMALAIESWSWRADKLAEPVYVRPETKPRDFGLDQAPPQADLVVARMKSDFSDFDYKAKPRLWIELKERGTWWGETEGYAKKAFGTANNGLRADLTKWSGVKESGNAVIVCQVTTHDGTYENQLPKSWAAQFDEIARDYARALKPRCVGYELKGDAVRWTRFDAFIVSRG